jgi:1-acyl-sn-glycerol-3-phosphate acyltransferase
MAHFFVKNILYPLMRLVFVKKIKGIKNLPKKEPYIVAANHASYIDGPLLLLIFLWHKNREVRFIIYPRMFATSFRRFVFHTWFDQIKENHSVKKALDYLDKGVPVGIFPEGRRTEDGKLQKVKHTGLGVLALKTKLPVVPIGIKGTFELWPRQQKYPSLRRIVTINIGKPIKFKLSANKKNYKTVSNKVMKKIGDLVKNA